MKKIIYTTLFCVISTASFSSIDNKTVLLSGIKSEVTIVPLSKSLPESMMKEHEEFLKQQKEKGYSDIESKYPKTLLSMNKNRSSDFTKSNDASDTHLKYSPDQVKVAFNFKPVPGVNYNDVIGFSAKGAYLDKQEKWTGITEFFNYKNIGTCDYSVTNMALSHGSAKIDPSAVRYDVNNKPSDIFVEGSLNSGFIYNVIWFNKEYIYMLECANMNYYKSITDNVIELAKIIDRNNS